MKIRLAKRTDVPSMREIFNEVLRNSNSIYREEEVTLEERYAWFDEKLEHGFPIFGAYEGDHLIGYAGYGTWRAAQGYRKSVELTIYVDQKFRGVGIGSALMKTIIDHAKTDGYHVMIGAIDAANQQSIEFHKRFGFVEVARMPEVALKNDQWLTLVFMQKLL
ncbi:MAG: GNAT family N-acetyltransferase [Candidatus Nanopelagicaceae bacterium]|jgi:L-amino acid N-acyltransferase YncA